MTAMQPGSSLPNSRMQSSENPKKRLTYAYTAAGAFLIVTAATVANVQHVSSNQSDEKTDNLTAQPTEMHSEARSLSNTTQDISVQSHNGQTSVSVNGRSQAVGPNDSWAQSYTDGANSVSASINSQQSSSGENVTNHQSSSITIHEGSP